MPPNVAVIVADTARAGDTLDAAGTREDSALRSLADEGAQFDTAFTTSPWTLPAHASLFTGQYPSRHGADANTKRLRSSTPTLAERFGDSGYETVAFTNNAWVSEEFGMVRGFDRVERMWQLYDSDVSFGQIALTNDGLDKYLTALRALLSNNAYKDVLNAVYGKYFYRRNDYGAARTNGRIEDWLAERDNSDPFFAFVNYLEPHLDYQPPAEFAEPFLPDGWSYEDALDVPQEPWAYLAGETSLTDAEFDALRALYRAEIAYFDDRIGDLRRTLEAAGEWDDTIVAVVGDHGENVGEHDLMDHQFSLHDTTLNVPLIIGGGAFEGHGTDDRLVSIHDLYPTLLDAAGVADGEESAPQARSFAPGSDAPPREFVAAEYDGSQPSVETLERRFGSVPDRIRAYGEGMVRAIRTPDEKLVRNEDGPLAYYRLSDDPDETTNRVDAETEAVDRLGERLDRWVDSTDSIDAGGQHEMSTDAKRQLEDLGYLQ